MRCSARDFFFGFVALKFRGEERKMLPSYSSRFEVELQGIPTVTPFVVCSRGIRRCGDRSGPLSGERCHTLADRVLNPKRIGSWSTAATVRATYSWTPSARRSRWEGRRRLPAGRRTWWVSKITAGSRPCW